MRTSESTGRRRRRRALPAVLTLVLLAAAAPALLAHDLWIEPLVWRPAPGASLGLELLVGPTLEEAEPLLPEPGSVERFVLRAPDGRETRVATPKSGYPAGLVRVPGPGAHVLVYRSRPSRVELAAEKFEHYLHEEGLEAIVSARAARGEASRPGRELFSRCAKALVRTAGAPTAAWTRPVGLRLELVPVSDVGALGATGGSLRARLLYEGKPLRGALVAALSRAGARVAARSDEDGLVSLALPRGGFWLVKAVHMLPVDAAAAARANADWESLWASLAFEVGG